MRSPIVMGCAKPEVINKSVQRSVNNLDINESIENIEGKF